MRVLTSETPRPLDLLAVGPDGLIAATCSTIGVGGDVEVWTLTTGAVQHRSWVSDREARGLAFTPDGHYLLAGEAEAIVALDLVADGMTPGPPPILGYPEFALSADGRHLFVTEADSGRGVATVLEVGDGLAVRMLWRRGLDGDNWFKLPAMSRDGSRVAVARRGRRVGGETVEVRSVTSGHVRAEIRSDPADLAQQLAFTADGAQLLVRPIGRTVRVFDAATGQPAGELLHPGRPYVTGLAVHPNGTVATSRNNGTVCLWDWSKRELVRTFDWKLGKLVSVAFAPDGSIGAAGTEDGQVVVWDVDE